jgi:hypothetical protein
MYTVPQLWDIEMAQMKLEQGKKPDPEMWRWSPLDIIEFDRMLNVAWHIAMNYNIFMRGANGAFRRVSIAEPGCGIGTKLYLAKTKYGMSETGYEINKEYVQKAAELGLEVNIETRDLRAGPQPPWAMFDIVYTSRPFKDDREEREWERSVQEAMRPGAVLISAFTSLKPYKWPCHYRFPFHGVWHKDPEGIYARRS